MKGRDEDRPPVLIPAFLGTSKVMAMDRPQSGCETLLKAVRNYENLLERSAGLSPESLIDRREAVKLRRSMADAIKAIAEAGLSFFAGRKDEAAFRGELGRVRSTMAYHQASWPIVAVDSDDEKYRSSVAQLRSTNEQFIAWMRKAMTA